MIPLSLRSLQGRRLAAPPTLCVMHQPIPCLGGVVSHSPTPSSTQWLPTTIGKWLWMKRERGRPSREGGSGRQELLRPLTDRDTRWAYGSAQLMKR